MATKTGSDRTEEFESLPKFLPIHEAAEEAVIYPALRALGDEGTRIVEARTQEEGVASDAITKLKGLDTGSAEFETTFTEFSAKVHQHAASEGAEVLPLLNSATTLEQRRAMGEAFLASQMGIPSRASNAPSTRLANATVLAPHRPANRYRSQTGHRRQHP